MESFKYCISLLVLQTLLTISRTTAAVSPSCPLVFREYIGALFNNVTFSDVPINPNVEFHFLLSFAIDYTNTNSPEPTNGDFLIYWDTENLTPSHISSIKAKHKNVKVGMSLGGDTVNGKNATFAPTSITSWVRNAIYSITKIAKEYNKFSDQLAVSPACPAYCPDLGIWGKIFHPKYTLSPPVKLLNSNPSAQTMLTYENQISRKLQA